MSYATLGKVLTLEVVSFECNFYERRTYDSNTFSTAT